MVAVEAATPIALRTWLGPLWDDAHAEPADTSTPRASSACSSGSPGTPARLRLTMCGARGAPAQFTPAETPAAASARCSVASSSAQRACRAAAPSIARRTAAPNPAIPGTFSVPERTPRCWPPPAHNGVMRAR